MRTAQPPAAAQPAAKATVDIPAHLLSRYVIDPATECWIWIGYRDRKGYGRVHFRGESYTAHRAIYEAKCGTIPIGHVLDHLCRVTSCVNPSHMDPTTTRINVARGESPVSKYVRARLTGVCINGHEIAEVGVHKCAERWTCAECGRERVRRYKARKRAVVMGISA